MSLREKVIRLASHAVPAAYRDEVVADLREQYPRLMPLLGALVRSGRDARVQLRPRTEPLRSATWLADVRAAWRVHRARPGAGLAVIMILAMAIGLNTSIYGMVEAVLVRPLPFQAPDRLVFVWNASPRLERESLSPARALDLRERVSAFEQAALIGHISMTVTGRGPAQRWFGASVSSSFFDVLRAPAAIGRTFRGDERDRDVVVLGHRLWVDQFGADPAVVGESLVMNGRSRQIVGVMPADFYWPSVTPETTGEDPPLFWTCAPAPDVPERPMVFEEDIARNRTTGFLRFVARLRADRTTETAQEEADVVAAALGREFPVTDGGRGLILVTAHRQLFGAVAQPMWFVLLASALVVLCACVNVGNLILVRQAGRRREFSIRSALGASRSQLLRQLMIEAGLLAAAGGVGGVLLGVGALRVLVALAPESLGRLDHAAINGGVLAWTALATLGTAIGLGALSALALWRDRSADGLRGTGGTPGRGRLRQGLVAAEAALAVTLLVAAALFGQSLLRLQRVDVGLDTAQLLTFDVMLAGERAEYQAKQLEFYRGLFERVRALPGVARASGAVTLPIGGDDFGVSAFPEGRPLPPPGGGRRIGFQVVWDGWFDTLDMRVLEGRDFGQQDTPTTQPVVVINRALADLEWPGVSPVGQRLKYARQEDAPWLTVIGVVNNVNHLGPGEPPRPELYLPYSQMTQAIMAVAVRTTGDPLALAPAIRAEAAKVDPAQPISGVSTMDAHLYRTYGRARFLATLTLLFGVVTCLLTLVGVYGVTSFAVAQRTKEFGVRASLGASPARLGRQVLRISLAPVWLGAAVGVGMALWSSRLVTALLFATTPIDGSAYVAATMVLLATAGLASLVPARRAAALDPVKALRDG